MLLARATVVLGVAIFVEVIPVKRRGLEMHVAGYPNTVDGKKLG